MPSYILTVLIGIFSTPLIIIPAFAAPLKVGLIAPLSGSAASYGIAPQNALKMALSKLDPDKIQLFFEDDSFDTKKTVAAFNKLVAVNKVDVLPVGNF